MVEEPHRICRCHLLQDKLAPRELEAGKASPFGGLYLARHVLPNGGHAQLLFLPFRLAPVRAANSGGGATMS